MVGEFEAELVGDFFLEGFDGAVFELADFSAANTG